MSFTRLGGVFSSVITGNIVLFGLAAARVSAGLAEHTAVSLAGYVLGVAIGARVIALAPRRGRPAAGGGRTAARGGQAAAGDGQPAAGDGRSAAGDGQPAAEGGQAAARGGQAAAGDGEDWPPMVTAALAVQLALLAALSAGWELAGARPAGAGQYLLLAAAATAMGVQSAAVRGLGRGDFSTTYLTGQLTGLIAALVTPGKREWPGWRQPGPLLALAAGALIGGALIANAPAAIPVTTLTPLCLVLGLYLTARGGGHAGNRA